MYGWGKAQHMWRWVPSTAPGLHWGLECPLWIRGDGWISGGQVSQRLSSASCHGIGGAASAPPPLPWAGATVSLLLPEQRWPPGLGPDESLGSPGIGSQGRAPPPGGSVGFCGCSCASRFRREPWPRATSETAPGRAAARPPSPVLCVLTSRISPLPPLPFSSVRHTQTARLPASATAAERVAHAHALARSFCSRRGSGLSSPASCSAKPRLWGHALASLLPPATSERGGFPDWRVWQREQDGSGPLGRLDGPPCCSILSGRSQTANSGRTRSNLC